MIPNNNIARIKQTFTNSNMGTGDCGYVDEYGRVWIKAYGITAGTGDKLAQTDGNFIYED